MKFSTTKTTTEPTSPDVDALRRELANHERALARIGSDASRIPSRIATLEADRKMLSGSYDEDGRIPASLRIRISDIDREMPGLVARLAEIEPVDRISTKRAVEIRAILASGIRLSAERAVEKAVVEAPSREKYLAAKQKLAQIRERLGAAEVDFEKARAATQVRTDRTSRAEAILELGLMPRTTSASTPEELNRAAEEISVFRQAVELQQSAVTNLRGELADEIRKALAPTCTTLIQRTADGYREVEMAALECYEIQEAVRRETDGRGIGEFAFPGVQPSFPGAYSEFESWIADKRKEGFEV